jgi:glutamine amidotransferase
VTRVAIVDYGAGNLASVVRGLSVAGADARVVATPSDAAGATGIVVPGVGHFAATAGLNDAWRVWMAGRIADGIPLFGICLGMQWLFESSDEAPGVPGLGLIPGRCARLAGEVKIPHVGWNTLERTGRPSALLNGVPHGAFAYFSHALAAPAVEEAVAMTTHGGPFAAAVERGRIWGVQFHPELSGGVGERILANFVGGCQEVG